MKKIFTFFTLFLFFLFNHSSYAEDALTVKQQLDRLIEEVKDLNKAVFNKNEFKLNEKKNDIDNDTERFTSIDIRIYDLEKDIKNLTFQFEEIFFKLDDISNNINFLETKLIDKIEKNQLSSDSQNIAENKDKNQQVKKIKEDNTLGELTISDNDQKPSDKTKESKNLVSQTAKQKEILDNLSPEELLQFSFDQMMKKNYDYSKDILENLILKYPENQLSGSAHFWLGKIYLFELDYRKAAIIFGEGVQKFPKSIKAPEMYYELAKSLNEMNKIPEACKTLSLLEENYKGNKYTKDPEKIKVKLNCEILN